MEKLKGTFTALATPFRNGDIDWESLGQLVKKQIDDGIDGFVVNGTTGESPTLEVNEVEKIFRFVKERAPNSVLILGTGSNNTQKTVELTLLAKKLNADAALVVVPYYNKPPQRGLVAHFTEVANVGVPILLYNVPGRTITSLSVESISELSKHPHVVGIKEATGDIELMKQMQSVVGKEFIFLSGDDGTYIEFLKAGGHGVISVASHILPRQMIAWKKWVQAGMSENAEEDIKKYKHLIDLLFVEANPIPLKMALHKLGVFNSAELRLPLVELHEKPSAELRMEMQSLGVLK